MVELWAVRARPGKVGAMRGVAIARANALTPSNCWDQSLSELALAAAAPIVSEVKVDSIFAAASAPSLVQRQADFAAIVSDRLNLTPKVSLAFDAGDVSGAAALYAAWMHVGLGMCDAALVVGAAKSSDLAESERLALMNCTLDHEAGGGDQIDFASQAGLLASHYCARRGTDPGIFTEASAANYAAWAKHTEGVSLSGAELRRDLVVAPPLVRSDFAQLLDGACAVLLTAKDDAAHAHLTNVATATDVVSVWERSDALSFRSVSMAAKSALKGEALPRWVEIDAAASVVQILSQDALEVSDRSRCVVNIVGGTQGRGRVPGVSPLYQVADAAFIKPPYSHVLAVSVAGLASRAYAAHIVRKDAA